ncbi:MAG: hypothetical protein KatS3mg104_1311 [Phycisphaerae bacterium]|jgi:uncharacterized membrane protein YccC|nr:MAG: hypothetical protein KatS3mg104_1311 [Phycisphaerae bacterium]
MSQGAKVRDIEAIRQFRAALVKFVESAGVALTDAEGEITRKLTWLETEQSHFWISQVRKWSEEVNRAKDAVRQKRIFKDSLGRPQSTVDEEKYLKKCQKILEQAEQKLENTRRHAKQLQREHLLYRGGVQRLATALSSDLPNAIALLDRITDRLEQYVASSPVLVGSDAEPPFSQPSDTLTGSGSMKRAVQPPEPDKPESDPVSTSEQVLPTPDPQQNQSQRGKTDGTV